MRLTGITINNVIGCRRLAVAISAPNVLFAGDNEAGKTSIVDAMRLAFTGEPTRVALKKDYPFLVSTGTKAGDVVITWDGGEAKASLPDGKRSLSGDLHRALPFVLDMQRFSRLDDDQRREFLFALIGLSTNGDDIRAELEAARCGKKQIDAVMPKLATGFDAALAHAKERAKDEKAAWKATTGETWGSDKGEKWQAAKPTTEYTEPMEQALATAKESLADLESQLAGLNAELGALQQSARTAQQQARQRAELQEKAERLPRLRAKLEHDQKELDAYRTKRAEAEQNAALAGKRLPCPCCGVLLVVKDDALVEAGDAPSDDSAAMWAQQFAQSVQLLERAVMNDQRDIADAEAAERSLKDLPPPESCDEEAIQAKRQAIETLQGQIRSARQTVSNIEADIRMAAEADGKTARADATHKEIQAWLHIAEQLEPSGIPGKMVAAKLTPFNRRLLQAAQDTGWPQVTVDGDMSIYYNGLPYGLLSESGKWRADAMLTEAISFLSGIRFMVLDRLDILSLTGRGQALGWLDILAAEGDVDTVCAFATLKSIPAGLPATYQAHWIESGTVTQLAEAA